jgi:hypothetical protein
MYTTIATAHALDSLRAAVPAHVLAALEIVMKNKIFQFSDRYYKQLDGTAMGTPPACMWATLYGTQWVLLERNIIYQAPYYTLHIHSNM